MYNLWYNIICNNLWYNIICNMMESNKSTCCSALLFQFNICLSVVRSCDRAPVSLYWFAYWFCLVQCPRNPLISSSRTLDGHAPRTSPSHLHPPAHSPPTPANHTPPYREQREAPPPLVSSRSSRSLRGERSQSFERLSLELSRVYYS